MKLTSWVLGAALAAAPLMYSQQAVQQPPQAPAATGQSNNGQVSSPPAQPNSMSQSSLPQSDQAASASSPFEQEMIFGTGMTVAELRQAGYNDQEIAKLRTDSQALMASGTQAPGTASGTPDQAQSAANGVSQPAYPTSDTAQPARSFSSNHSGLWGLLGLLGLLGLAGRRRREAVVERNARTLPAERDRVRVMQDRGAAERAARDRETAIVENDRRIAAMDHDRMRELDREAAEHAARDRETISANDYRDQDIVAESDLPDRPLDDKLRDRKVEEIRERDHQRKRDRRVA